MSEVVVEVCDNKKSYSIPVHNEMLFSEFKGIVANTIGIKVSEVVFSDLNSDTDRSISELGIIGGIPLSISNSKKTDSENKAVKKYPLKSLSWKNAEIDLTRVWGNIYISGQQGASCPAVLSRSRICCVINCCDRIQHSSKLVASLSKYHVAKSFFDTKSVDMKPFLPPMFEILNYADANNKNVLVHCLSGASRSSSVVIAWLITVKGYRLQDCIQKLRDRRSIVRPNKGFLEQLTEMDVQKHK